MAYQKVVFTETDYAIINTYKTTITGLADFIGNGYEFVLHSLENLEHSVVAIINGHYTGRKVGAPITDLALKILDDISEGKRDHITYFSKNKKGEPLKSSTIAIRGEDGRIIGLLCINFYMNTSIYDIVSSLTAKEIYPQNSNSKEHFAENFVENSDELIETALLSAKQSVYADQTISASNKNKAIIHILEDYGIFNIKDSVSKVADLLVISKNTVYLHIRNRNLSGKS